MYEYDRGGNITRTIQYTYTTGEPSEVLTDRTYAYDTVWKDKLITRGDRGLTYDAIGNLTQYSGWTYEWEAGRRLKRQTQENTVVTYEYDHSGMRVRKTVSGTDGTVRTVYDYAYCGGKLAHMTWGSNWMHFFYDAQGRPAKVRYNGTIYSYIHNLQGDIAGLLDGSGNVVVEYKYDAWGFLLSRTGSMAADLGKQNPFRYRGYIYDEETWMYWLKSRYYYPELQRFINADTVMGQIAKLASHNGFAYCANNPVIHEDSNGQTPGCALVAGGVTALAVNRVKKDLRKHPTSKSAAMHLNEVMGKRCATGSNEHFRGYVSYEKITTEEMKIRNGVVMFLDGAIAAILAQNTFDLVGVLSNYSKALGFAAGGVSALIESPMESMLNVRDGYYTCYHYTWYIDITIFGYTFSVGEESYQIRDYGYGYVEVWEKDSSYFFWYSKIM